MRTTDDPVVSWSDITAQPLPPPGRRIAYGSDPEQFGELRLPSADGPHPVVVVLHGGCWQSAYDLEHISHVSAALARSGLAVWTVEYRRIGHAGGGWTGTFDDVVRGTNHLRVLAEENALDLDRGVALLGHSAGGHLALWLASRRTVPPAEQVEAGSFDVGLALAVRGVVSLAGITDLRDYAAGDGSCNASVEPLLGGAFEAVPARYAAASPIEQVPLGVPARLLHGRLDSIVPLAQSERFAAQARAAGDAAVVEVIEGAGHFDLIAPFAPAWPSVEAAVHELFSAP
ncbi:alpha/beta hydrolase [Wenzhouxiangella sp. XN24]|nr:alpha/beta hydrolase [Wenzhouxiangella sp. XN24]NGX17702.1 alpha/beta hydrolase [Wenzhouxiangella sp. XN24]